MDQTYDKARQIITSTRKELTKLFNAVPSEDLSLEDSEAFELLDSLIENIATAEKRLIYLGSPVKEGVLAMSTDERFYIEFPDEEWPLTCGSPLELYSDDEWHMGRVEARDGRYYFRGDCRPFLHSGMRVRIR